MSDHGYSNSFVSHHAQNKSQGLSPTRFFLEPLRLKTLSLSISLISYSHTNPLTVFQNTQHIPISEVCA